MIKRKPKHLRCSLAALDSPGNEMGDVIHARSQEHVRKGPCFAIRKNPDNASRARFDFCAALVRISTGSCDRLF